MKLMVRLFFFLFVVGLIGATPAAAQTSSSVSGTITNADTGGPIAGAVVALELPTGSRYSVTGADGKFTISDVPAGTYHANVRADGFTAARLEITVGATTPALEAKLSAAPHYTEVVSVSPDARSQLDAYQATNVLGGQDLASKLQATLGATLANEPGVSLRSFGPGPARPVIRGFDGDRVLILEDGQRMGDLSSQSGDHGVNVNPAGASKIEVVRGPATLLYGANAIGGLVNVITNDIPRAPVTATTGQMTFDAGTAAGEAGGAGDVTVGNGKVALHFAGSGRRAGNYSTPDGDVPNSFSRAGLAQAGVSFTSHKGYVGAGVSYDRTHYGIPLVEAGQTNLDPRRKNFDFRAERRDLSGFITSFRAAVGIRRYAHDELDGDTVATSFINNTSEVNLLAAHKPAGRLKGSLGASFLTRDFSTAGEEVLSSQVDQTGAAAFVYEEATLSPHASLQFGGRVDQANFTPAEGLARKFTNVSGSFGFLVHPTDETTIALSLARAARNPALEELYFHGPHPGTASVENGDETLEPEHGIGFDASVRWAGRRATGEVTFFVNRINNYIFRQFTGEIEDDLPVTFFTQGDATIQGVEAHVDLQLHPILWLELGLDSVRGELTSIDRPVPRMPPTRGRFGLRIQKNALEAGFDASFTAKQDRVFNVTEGDNVIGETPTDGYNLLKVFLAYTFGSGRVANTLAVRMDNATNARYSNHLNYLKDFVPEVGRDFRVTFTTKF